MQDDMCPWCNYTRNNVFRSKETTKMVVLKLFRGFEARRKPRLLFWRPKNTMKDKCYVFSGYKERNKDCLVYLECKLQEVSYGWCILKLKCQKRNKVPLMLLDVKALAVKLELRFSTLSTSRQGTVLVFGV